MLGEKGKHAALRGAQAANSLALGTSPVVRALFDPEGGMRDVRALDRVSFTDWFKSHGGSQGSIDKMWCASAPGCCLPWRPVHRIWLPVSYRSAK